MQQMTPPSGHLFPDHPQQQSSPRFASNAPKAAQAYEPQVRMQQTGSVPVMTVPRYATGQLQALHGSIPATQMPPLATLPTAQVYQQQLVSQQVLPAQAAQVPESAITGTPLMVPTVQGAPVVVNYEEMMRAIEEMEQKPAMKKKRARKEKQEEKQKRSHKIVLSFSLLWIVFGVIGMISTALWLWEWIVYGLVWVQALIGGAA